MIRALAAAAAAAAVVGAVVTRQWDLQAGKRVAELTRARTSDGWRHEERTAELEADLEESRELRGKLEAKLRAKRVELAALRTEHAALLRRYATAETERASALEGRRQLAIGAAEPTRAALPPALADGGASGGASDAASGAASGGGTSGDVPRASLYARANDALDRLARGGAPERRDATAAEEAGAGQGKPEAVAVHERAAAGHYTVPAAAAVVPHTPVRRGVVGGFDFFGTQDDLADVVGEEVMAIHEAESQADLAEASAAADDADTASEGPDAKALPPGQRVAGQVIDLTEHDETEQINMSELRTAIS